MGFFFFFFLLFLRMSTSFPLTVDTDTDANTKMSNLLGTNQSGCRGTFSFFFLALFILVALVWCAASELYV